MKNKVIITDCFNVLIDEDAPRFFKENIDPIHYRELSHEYFSKGDRGEITFDGILTALSKRYNIPYQKIHDSFFYGPKEHKKYTSYLRSLHQEGYMVVLLSDAPDVIVPHFLDYYHMRDIFDQVFISSEMKRTKEDASTFLYVLSCMKKKPEEAIFVDDNLGNVERAKSVGIQGIQYLSEDQAIEELKKSLV